MRFIEENKDSPFCLYVAHEAPHYPYQGPNDKADRTIGGSAPNHGTRKDIAGAYKEMIEEMDKGVGEIVTTLRRCGLEQNTLIFFFSDNGAMKYGSNGPLHGFKGSLWEGGHRVPAIAYWPGKIAPGQTSNQTTISLDLFPTMIALGGGVHPTRTQNRWSQSPAPADKQQAHKRPNLILVVSKTESCPERAVEIDGL